MIKYNQIAKITRLTLFILVFCVTLCLIILQDVYGHTEYELRQTIPINQVSSGNQAGDDYLRLTTTGSSISVTFKHSQPFDRIVLRLMSGGSIKNSRYYTDSSTDGTFVKNYDFSEIPNGDYHFRVAVQKDSNLMADLTNYPTYIQGVNVTVRYGIPTMYTFDHINQSNQEKTTISSSRYYRTKSLIDLKRQVLAKKGTVSDYRTVNEAKESAFFKQVADKVLKQAGASNSSDYTKMKVLFNYVSSNFYYDNRAKSKGYRVYDDPYYNLSYFINKTGNNYNAFSGKVAIHCDGYTGILIALGRSQDIPCRMIYGRKVTASTNWTNCPSSYFDHNSHTWMQAWVDGRWINIDPQQGSMNFYGNVSDADDRIWRKSEIINFSYFDISDTLLSYTHFARVVVSGAKTALYMDVPSEISQLKTFLSSYGNGVKLNSRFKAGYKSTWGTNAIFETDGFGSMRYITASNEKLRGHLDLSNFAKLQRITISNNSLTRLTIQGSPALQYIYASSNKFTSADLSAQENLLRTNFSQNPLQNAQFHVDSTLRTITSTGNGTFGFKYYKSDDITLTVYPSADIGYKYLGLYNELDQPISTNSYGYTFNPVSAQYSVKFELNPDSYRYTLRKGNSSDKKPYNLALQKRLKELGYYMESPNGLFHTTTVDAVKAFQSNNGMTEFGYVGKTSWKKLFSTTAIPAITEI